MECIIYNNIKQFSDSVINYLELAEAQNNLMISGCLKPAAETAEWLMASVNRSTGTPQIIAMMTPPYNLMLYAVDNRFDVSTLRVLIDGISIYQHKIPGVFAEKKLAAAFADIYTHKTNQLARPDSSMKIYWLDNVNQIAQAPGLLRQADFGDLFYLPYWDQAFQLNCALPMDDLATATAKTKNRLENKMIYVWEDGVPVSQAAVGRKTIKGSVINAVYTPPHYRNKGYATACVSSLSQLLLEQGSKFCCLFADQDNPISNRLYLNIGYMPGCVMDQYKFANQNN